MRKKGVLILNLGTPDSPSVKDVRVYLREFLNDPRVIDLHWINRLLLVNLIIVPLRAPKSAKKKQKLFKIGNGKSPLLTYSENLKSKVSELSNGEFEIELAMRYGNPSMDKVLEKMSKQNYDELYIFPLYPQYASASSGSTIEKAFRIINKWWVIPEVKVIGQFYNNSNYIDCIVNRSKQFNLSEYDHIVFSYHGIPERHVDKVYLDNTICAEHNCDEGIDETNTHCYKATCYATTELLTKKLFDFCELGWSENILKFYKRKDLYSKTLSFNQIRSKVLKYNNKKYQSYFNLLTDYKNKYYWLNLDD